MAKIAGMSTENKIKAIISEPKEVVDMLYITWFQPTEMSDALPEQKKGRPCLFRPQEVIYM